MANKISGGYGGCGHKNEGKGAGRYGRLGKSSHKYRSGERGVR